LFKIGNGSELTSPHSPANITRSPAAIMSPYISAMIGPMTEKSMDDFYKEWRSTKYKQERVEQRRQNPSKGFERQCDNAARKILVNLLNTGHS